MEQSVVVKIFRLLETLGAAPAGCALGDAADVVGMPKPTVHRLLKMMIDLGYVDQSERRLYRLTSRIDQLRPRGVDRQLLAAAEESLAALHRETGENVNLGIVRADRVMYLRVFESTHALRRIAEPNSTDPVHSTALGRSIASFMPPTQRDALLERTQPFARRTPHTESRLAEIVRILDRARKDGFAIERNETDLGVSCYAAPIFAPGDSVPVAAVSLSVPSARCEAKREKELLALVRETARRISGALETTGELK